LTQLNSPSEKPGIDSIFNAFAQMLIQHEFYSNKQGDKSAWESLFACPYSEVEEYVDSINATDGNDKFGLFWRKFNEDFIVSIELSVCEDSDPFLCNYGLTCSIRHLPTAKLLTRLTGGEYRPYDFLYEIGVLNYFYKQNFKSFIANELPKESSSFLLAENRITNSVWQSSRIHLVEYHSLGIQKDLMPWLKENCSRVAMYQQIFSPKIPNLLGLYTLQEIAFMLETGHFKTADTALKIRLDNDKSHADSLRLPEYMIEAERKKHLLADSFFGSAAMEFIRSNEEKK
jgi:hypothetical protein